MRLMEIMTTDVRTASATEDAEKAFQRMRNGRIRHLVVMDGRRVVGVLSEGDVGGPRGSAMRAGKTVGELMSGQAITASPTTTVRQAANLLRARNIGCLPVLEDGELAGIVTVTDVLELLGRQTQLSPTACSRFKPQHGSKWKPIRRWRAPSVHPCSRGSALFLLSSHSHERFRRLRRRGPQAGRGLIPQVQERVRLFRGDYPPPVLRDRTVILVDDGIATGGTVHAAIRSIRAQGPRAIVLAVPVASPEVVEALGREVDRVVCLRTPADLYAIGVWYVDFSQVSETRGCGSSRPLGDPQFFSCNGLRVASLTGLMRLSAALAAVPSLSSGSRYPRQLPNVRNACWQPASRSAARRRSKLSRVQ